MNSPAVPPTSLQSAAPPAPPFPDVPALLAATAMRRHSRWPLVRFFTMGLCVVLAGWLLLGDRVAGGNADAFISIAAPLLLLALMIAASVAFIAISRRARTEQAALDGVEEMIQLRRWPEAAATLEHVLARPMQSVLLQCRALVHLAAVLSRYQRHADAEAVQSYLLDHAPLDPATAYGLKVGRAMAMLHEDHLVDADRAIADLRRAGGRDTGPLSLVELYRDVKTGHPAEAAELFEQRLANIRSQLGHRAADAFALAAWAYERLARPDDARRAYEAATALAPAAELVRRYPEVKVIAEQYRPAAAPPEML